MTPSQPLTCTALLYLRRLKSVCDAQSAINAHGAILESLDHLASQNDLKVREVLAFNVIMLQHGNEAAQVCPIGSKGEPCVRGSPTRGSFVVRVIHVIQQNRKSDSWPKLP